MTGTRTTPTFERQLIGLAVAACFAGIVHANPTGPAVAHGSASFATSGNTLTVTNTPGAIINWQAFSIRPDEVTRFIQSGAASAVLNRVTGPGQSALLGQLLSNGRVFLINPNGVVVGAGARIDTAGFVASSLSLSNEDFLAGRFRFTDPGNAGKVTNAGSIHAHSGGPVYLIAPTVENHGVITAPNGDITLAAGKSVELVSAGNPHLRVQVQAGGEAINVGQLLAESGRVGLYGAAIRNAGTVSADSASVNAAGNVVLKASRDVTLESTSVVSASGAKGGTVEIQAEQGTLLVDGRVDAKGATGQGGDVKLLGTQVGVVGNAAVDASGATGGGLVLVGGDYQGQNPDIQNAARVVLAADAKIAADSTDHGDGGRVIVWSDEYTGFYGAISARGGAAGGNGGFVETSSKDNLQALGMVDAAAPAGAAGQWLLDPANVTISAGATANGTFSGVSPNIFSTTANSAVANVTTIQTSLNLGTSVTINTTPGGTEAGNITVAVPIAKTAGGNAALTLNATNGIIFNAGADISSSAGQLNVALNASGAGGISNLANVNTNGGTLTLNSPGAMSQAAGTAIQGTGALTKVGAGTLTLSGANTYAGATTVSAGTVVAANATALGTVAGATTVATGATLNVNGVTIAENLTINGTGVGAGGALTGSGAAEVSGAVTLASNSSMGVGAGSTLTVSGAVGQAGGNRTLTKVGAGTLTLSGAANNTYAGATTVSAGTLVAAKAGALGTAAGGTTVAAGATLNIDNAAIGTEAVTLNGTLQGTGTASLAGGVALGAASAVNTAVAGDTLTLSGVVSGANRTLTKAGAGTLVLSGNNTYSGATNVNGGTLRIAGANERINNASAVTVAAGATLDLNNFNETIGSIAGAGNVTLGTATLTAGGNNTSTAFSGVASGAGGLTKAGTGTLTLSGANTYAGATNVNAGTLSAANATALGTVAGATTVATGATLNVNGVTIAENLTINGTGVGAGGALTGSGAAEVSGAVTLASNSSMGVGAGSTLTVSGAIGQAGGNRTLTKVGAGTLTLSGANTYAGATTVSAGTVVAANATALGTVAGATTVATGATLNVNGVTIAENLTINGTGVGAGGALTGSGAAEVSGAVTLASNSSMGVGAGSTLTVSGAVGQAGGNRTLTKVGAGTLTLSGAANNTYAGATTVSAGTLVAAKAGALGTAAGGTTVAAGATLNIDNAAIGTEAVTLNGTLQGTGTASLAGGVALGAASAVNTAVAGDTLTLSGVVSGANRTLTKAGAGTLVLSGNNTYSGATNVNGGTLRIAGANERINNASAVTVAAGATLDLNNFNETIGSIAGAGNVTLGTATLTAGGNNTSTAFSGVASGAGGLTKAGTGTLTLSGANTYAGATNVNAGTLSAANATALGTVAGATTVATGATLNVNGVTIAENLTINGTGVGAGGALTGSGAAEVSGAVTLASNSSMGVGAGSTLTVSGAIGQAGGNRTLTKVGAGTLTLSGANTYAGATTVSAGTVVAANATALGTVAGATTVATGATLNVNGVTIAENLTINGTGVGAGGALTGSGAAEVSGAVTLATASSVGAAAGNSLALNGTVEGPGALNVAGGGTVTFGNTVGNVTLLSSVSSAAGTALNVNGSLVRTTGAQTYNGSVTLGFSTVLTTTANGNITANGSVNASGNTITLAAGAGNVSMTNAANDFGAVVVTSGGAVSLFDSNALTVGPVTGTGDVLVQTNLATGNDITLAGNITSTTGNVTVASGDDINYGAFVPSAPMGRWLTYSFSPATNTGTPPVPGGAKPNIYNCTFGGPCGATIPAGNHNVYRYQPLLTYTANAANRQYGDLNPAFSGAVSGLVNGDTAADAYSGTLAFTSPAVGTTPVGGAAIIGSGLTSDIGYGFAQAPGNATALTITPRPITLTAGSAARAYGDPNPAPAPLYTVGGNGMANAESAQTLFGFTVASGAIGTTPVGVYAAGANAYNVAGVGVGANGNYTITAINPGTLTIDTAPLTVTANNAVRPESQPNPPFSATYAGFKNAETPAALGGALAFTTPATIASPPGGYAITPFGQTATNYRITYVDGVLTVTPLPVIPIPPAGGGVAAADNAFITATQRSAEAEEEIAPRVPGANGVDCLELERAGVRRVLTRCF